MERPENVGFHEASIIEINQENQTIRMVLEGVHVHINDQPRNASVCLNGVGQIICDELPISELVMEYPDGEVLTLDMNLRPVLLIVEWNDFEHHRQKTRCYRISCETADVHIDG